MVRRSDQQSLVIWTTLLCIKSSFSRYRTIRHGGYGSLFSLFGQALAGLQQGDLQLGTHLLLLSRDGKGAEIAVSQYGNFVKLVDSKRSRSLL